MTREEIIDGLKFTVGMFLFDPLTGETITEPRNDMDKITIDACRGAIELLEQETCEDCMSRQAVKDTIFAECSSIKLDIDFAKVLLLQRAIEALPLVTPQPKTGHWIALGNYDDWGNESSYKCSECGELDGYPDNYCPNCGCRMAAAEARDKK